MWHLLSTKTKQTSLSNTVKPNATNTIATQEPSQVYSSQMGRDKNNFSNCDSDWSSSTYHRCKWWQEKYNNLTFGGVSATNNTILFTLSGWASPANWDSSLCMDSYGALLTTLVAHVYIEFYHLDTPPHVNLYIDNKELISQLQTKKRPIPSTKDLNAPEFNTIHEAFYHLSKCNYTIQHVKSHQTSPVTWQQK